MKSFKQFLEEEFALPKYPAQTDIKFKDDDWVVGDPEKKHSNTTLQKMVMKTSIKWMTW